MKVIVAITVLLAGCASANEALLPPAPYDRVPSETVDWRSLDHDTLLAVCAQHDVVAPVVLGCEWGWGTGVIHSRTLAGDARWTACRIRHANGHITTYEETGDPNRQHMGWEYRAC